MVDFLSHVMFDMSYTNDNLRQSYLDRSQKKIRGLDGAKWLSAVLVSNQRFDK